MNTKLCGHLLSTNTPNTPCEVREQRSCSVIGNRVVRKTNSFRARLRSESTSFAHGDDADLFFALIKPFARKTVLTVFRGIARQSCNPRTRSGEVSSMPWKDAQARRCC